MEGLSPGTLRKKSKPPGGVALIGKEEAMAPMLAERNLSCRPRESGDPYTVSLPMWHPWGTIALLVFMGPRFRGDDTAVRWQRAT